MSTPLDDYMTRADVKDADLAAQIERDRSVVNKLRRGTLRPTLEVAAAIERATNGEVPMQAWTDLTAQQAAA
jgi:ribosome-binding protein aMBF1 (putative translation factor)